MSDTGGVSLGEAGGILAGSIGVLAVIGKGIQWVANWRDTRAETRSAKLQRWHDELERREEKIEERDREYQAKIEKRLARLALENRVLRAAFELVSKPLQKNDPENPDLAKARELLARAFPLDPLLPPEMGVLLSLIDGDEVVSS